MVLRLVEQCAPLVPGGHHRHDDQKREPEQARQNADLLESDRPQQPFRAGPGLLRTHLAGHLRRSIALIRGFALDRHPIDFYLSNAG